MQTGSRIQRITAPNPGVMTGNGTNSYLLRAENGDCIVIDPGPDIAEHIEALIRAAGGADRIKSIVVTHMHPDHSPAAMPLAAATGATLRAPFAVDDPYQDTSCVPHHLLAHDEVLVLGELKLRAIHTPGHVDNHMCFLLENEQVLFTGDHLMQGSTVVIIPPHGNMKKYIASLQLLLHYPIARLAPGHGEFMHDPVAEIEHIVRHRLAREAKLVGRLKGLPQPVTVEELVPDVYDDVDPGLHAMASLSLLAHLLKLEEEGKAAQEGGRWQLSG